MTWLDSPFETDFHFSKEDLSYGAIWVLYSVFALIFRAVSWVWPLEASSVTPGLEGV